MKREMDTRVAVGIAALLLVIGVVILIRIFGGGSGRLTPAEAGLGRPLQPGEIPGENPRRPESQSGR